MGLVIHLAGVDMQVGCHLRQRCGWCGAVLIDVDLHNIASLDGDPYPTWRVGGLVAADGGASYIVEHNDGDDLPPESCGQLDPSITA